MASRYYTSQFSYSFERMCVSLMGNAQQTSAGAFASLVSGGITYTAVTMGSAGNSITIAIVGGGTAGSEVVSVSGSAISIQIESGVSTRNQVVAAIQASAAASALIGVSATSGGTAASLLSATALASGADTVFSVKGLSSVTLTQIGTGLYKLAIADAYNALLNMDIMLQRATAVDLQPQIASVDVSSAKVVTFRMLAGATPTNLSNNDILYIRMDLRNSSQSP